MRSASTQRVFLDKLAQKSMFLLCIAAILMVVFIGAGLFLKSSPIFEQYDFWTLISSSEWLPGQGKFGFLPFIAGTVGVTGLALLISLPIALLTALFLTEHSKAWVRKWVYPALDILAGLPSVVYGVWGSLLIVPWISEKLAPHFVEYSTGYTTLAGGIVLAVMILPLLVSLFIELFTTVPRELREASLSLGATKWQTSKYILLRKTFPGIFAAVILAVSRAFGETIAVLMVCGNIPQVPGSIFDACYPIPALIANNYGEMLSIPLYEAALMMAAFLLFIVVFTFNAFSRIILYRIEQKYR